MHCYSGSAAQTWVSQLLCWGGRAMFVLQTRYNSAFLPSSPLNSIVATLDKITEGKKSVIHSVRSEMSWREHLCYNCYLVWSRSRGTFWKKNHSNHDHLQWWFQSNHDHQKSPKITIPNEMIGNHQYPALWWILISLPGDELALPTLCLKFSPS